jgi:UDP-glucose:(glucosyl)LPS alpha-1,3-glucosyltransferase/UDP-D-galactose:(glucosyl)LPS alpha-1,3-D-galactosyltransferase/UDP-glucose:(galactosyl)LPS alpha-1,2-glucosyltransferase
LDSGISAQNRAKIERLKGIFSNFSIKFVDVDCNKLFKNWPELKHISKDTYSRFLIPQILPTAEKVIYSDIDVAFVGDIRKLFDVDMQNNVLAAVPDYPVELVKCVGENNKRLDLPAENRYFNAGLLMINCRLWNEQKISEKLFKVTDELAAANKLKYADQDALNKVFFGAYQMLDRKFNVFVRFWRTNFAYQNIDELKNNSILYHFTGIDKPWCNKDVAGAAEFWQYVPQTAFAADIEKTHAQAVCKRKLKSLVRHIFSLSNEKEDNGQKHKKLIVFGLTFCFGHKD